MLGYFSKKLLRRAQNKHNFLGGKMGYKTIQQEEGFIIVDEDSYGMSTAEKPNRVTSNLDKNELKIKLLSVDGCPINNSCIGLRGKTDNVTYFCKHLINVVIPGEGHPNKSHAYVICGKLKAKE